MSPATEQSGAVLAMSVSQRNASGPDATAYTLSTNEFAALNQVKAQTVRKRFCITGGYFSIRPKKLANNRLAWPPIQVTA